MRNYKLMLDGERTYVVMNALTKYIEAIPGGSEHDEERVLSEDTLRIVSALMDYINADELAEQARRTYHDVSNGRLKRGSYELPSREPLPF